MDKSWMMESKYSVNYVLGVSTFMDFVHANLGSRCKIRCPCQECVNVCIRSQDEVEDHLLLKGISQSYSTWVYHGEKFDFTIGSSSSFQEIAQTAEFLDDGVHDLLEDVFPRVDEDQTNHDFINGSNADSCEEEAKKYSKLLDEAQCQLLPEYTAMSKLSFIVKLLHIKVYSKMSNKAINMILGLLKEAFPTSTIPSSYYEAAKTLRDIGLNYIPIHACKYDCVLYWGEFKDKLSCPTCGTSRWKVVEKKIPWKVLRYFPLKTRLQRLFMSKKTAEDMRWHEEKRVDDDTLRHPADGAAWKDVNKENEWFADDPRNVRLGLATDGFNLFGIMSSTYSMWPVIIMPYNLPPWKCMAEPFMMMSLLIPGRNSPGKDIDVYLRPLIEELKDLWENGVRTYDAYKKEYFQMHAAVLWTITDFPAYGDLSGWSTKGYLACPVCNEDAPSRKLRNKICYMFHRRYLPQAHLWRKSKMFDGKEENRLKPKEVCGRELLEQLNCVKGNEFGKHPNRKKRKRTPEELNWTKKSIFFELPYWKTMKLRHNLDVMHIEKNICDNILGTMMNIEGKTKDTVNARLDLEDMKIKKELHLQKMQDGSFLMPPACYTLSKTERMEFCSFLKTVKFPDRYASNISRCANISDGKITGLKSHDCHILLQRLIPAAVRNFVPKDVFLVLDELGNFFLRLCCKTLKKSEVEELKVDSVIILCKLEKIFPPAFFDVMVHLLVHLPQELMLGGPVHYRWMYPVERFLGMLKTYARNKARPEGCIAEAYISTECLTFCSMYLSGIETKFNREDRNDDEEKELCDTSLAVFSTSFRPLGASKYELLSEQEFEMMQWYILTNCDEVEPYLEKHKMEIGLQSESHIEERHRVQFRLWFKNHVISLHERGSEQISDELLCLAYGPDKRVQRYTGCIVNGVRFHTKARDVHLTSQNSGVMVEGNHENGEINFYGVLTDIIQLGYIKDFKVVLFKCEWFDLNSKKRRVHKDGHLLSININKCWYESDPFILSVQAKQVFYLNDTKLGKDWRVVQKFHHRHLYDVPEMQVVEDEEILDVVEDQQLEMNEINIGMQNTQNESLHRDDIAPDIIASDIINREIEDSANISVDSDQENEHEIEEEKEIEEDEYDTDIEPTF